MEEGVEPKRRGPGRPRGTKASEAQKAASKVNVLKATEARRARKAARDAAPPEKPRWKQLEDGDISVTDLTRKELRLRACANNDGSWEGKRHKLPQRIINRMYAEEVRRDRRSLDILSRPALRAIKTRLEDDDNPAQQFAAARMVMEYKVGKVPDVIHHGVETEFDRLAQSAFVIKRGTDLAQELEAHQEPQDDVIDVEVIEEEA